jgi:hypothetical protein
MKTLSLSPSRPRIAKAKPADVFLARFQAALVALLKPVDRAVALDAPA